MSFCRDGLTEDAVSRVDGQHFSAELSSGIGCEPQRKAKWSVPYLKYGLQNFVWVLGPEGLSGVVRGGLGCLSQHRHILAIDEPKEDNVGLEDFTEVARKGRRSR